MKRTFSRWGLLSGLFVIMHGAAIVVMAADDDEFQVRLRSRIESSNLPGRIAIEERPASWNAKETAIIVCDMWDLHHCLNAVRRGEEMAPTMDRVLKTARTKGSVIIHAPSSCTDAYKEHPARAHAIATTRSKSIPKDIGTWCYKIPAEEKGKYPIDQSDGGEDDDLAEHKEWAAKLASMGRNPKAPWKSQTKLLTIENADYISDNGEEIWSILKDRKIKNVVLLGVHLNMCVLGRPFGLRQLAKNGVNVVLMRDMTDTMYNPKAAPYVSHFTGTDLMVEHVEKYVCPSITSDQILGGLPFRFKDDKRPNLAMIIADDEYRTEVSLPEFAAAHLVKNYFVSYVLSPKGERDSLPGVNLLRDADVALVSARRRVLPKAQLDEIRAFVAAGKPIVGIRTANHAFAPKANSKVPTGGDAWLDFDGEVLGGHYTGHHKEGGTKIIVDVKTAATGESHAILKDIDTSLIKGNGSLYIVSPIKSSATPLLIGSIPNEKSEPIAWVHSTPKQGRVVYTSLGHIDDFQSPAFNKFLVQSIDWATHSK
jgi:nicotinamidase-related amidase/type 1 glutamine amidotransferase